MLKDGRLALRCKACYNVFPLNVKDRDGVFLTHLDKTNTYPHPEQAHIDMWTADSVPSISI